jgi:hypothetical protein
MNVMNPGIGHNQGPANMVEDLQERYKTLLDQIAEVKDAAESVPDEIASDDVQTRVAELIKKMRFVEKTADGARELEREPFAKKVTEVNGFFKTRIDALAALRARLNERSDAYLKKKAAAEARRLKEEEDRRRAAAEQAMREAQEAEAKKREAEERQRRAEQEERDAQAAREKAIAEAKAAEERAAAAKEREAKLKAEHLARAAEEARQAKEKAERDAADEARRQAEREAHEKLMAEAKAAREEEQRKAEEARAAAAKALEERRVAEEATRVAKIDAKAADRETKGALDTALREERRADRLAEKADGPESDLARTRSEYGAVSTLSRRWVCRVTDRNLLDKNALWHLIDGEAIEVALRKWMLLQSDHRLRVMPGAVMEEETVGQVR